MVHDSPVRTESSDLRDLPSYPLRITEPSSAGWPWLSNGRGRPFVRFSSNVMGNMYVLHVPPLVILFQFEAYIHSLGIQY